MMVKPKYKLCKCDSQALAKEIIKAKIFLLLSVIIPYTISYFYFAFPAIDQIYIKERFLKNSPCHSSNSMSWDAYNQTYYHCISINKELDFTIKTNEFHQNNSDIIQLTTELLPSKLKLRNLFNETLEKENQLKRPCLIEYANKVVFPKTVNEIWRSLIFFGIAIFFIFILVKYFLPPSSPTNNNRNDPLDWLCNIFISTVITLVLSDLLILAALFKFQHTFDVKNHILTCK